MGACASLRDVGGERFALEDVRVEGRSDAGRPSRIGSHRGVARKQSSLDSVLVSRSYADDILCSLAWGNACKQQWLGTYEYRSWELRFPR